MSVKPTPLNNTTILIQLLFLILDQDVEKEKLGASNLMLKSNQFLKAVAKFNHEENSTFQFLSNCGTYVTECPIYRSAVANPYRV